MIYDDKRRVTVWLDHDFNWLDKELERINNCAEWGEKVVLVSRSENEKCEPVNERALFYVNGYYKNGIWMELKNGKKG